MDYLASIALGWEVATRPANLLVCFSGVTIGTFVGVLPGLGALAAIAMLLPLTFYLDPISALVMLAGIYYGVQYGGSISAILLNLPGHAATAVTCLDGYPLAQQGRAGVALFISTVASFLGGCFSIVLMMAFAPMLAGIALGFGAEEYSSMMVLGLMAAATLGSGSPFKGIAMVVLGLLLGLIGTDVLTGHYRFTFGNVNLRDGLNIVAIAMGMFGVSEVLNNIAKPDRGGAIMSRMPLKALIPTRKDLRQSWWPILRGCFTGAVFGILPGTGASIAAFLAYAVEKRVSRHPERFGKGAMEGLAAPEAANNSAAQAAFIPTLSLGIPGDAVMALMLGALMIHGIMPGPSVVANNPDLFWGLVMSFWIGNVLLLILNIPLIGLWVRILMIPSHILSVVILFFICFGVYTVNYNPFDVLTVIVFGGFGYGMMLLNYPAAPLLLGFILGPLLEENLRRALLLGHGDPMVFLLRPVSATFLAIAAALIVLSVASVVRRRMRAARHGETF